MNKNPFLRESVLPVTLFCSALMFAPIYGGNDAIAAANVVQQTKTVKGKVLDDNGEPIIGASVKVVGTTNGAVTDLDGNFTLSNVSQNAVVEVSYIGYISQKIKTSGQSTLNVSLKEDNQSLEEVVVVGYGVQRKTDVTGAMTAWARRNSTPSQFPMLSRPCKARRQV